MKALFNLITHSGAIHSPDNIQYWRERFAGVALFGASVLMTLIYGYGLVTAINNQAWIWVTIATFGYALLILITFLPNIPYWVRTSTLLALVYGVGTYLVIRSGDPGVSGLLFVFLGILSVIFWGKWPGFSTITFGAFTLIALGIGYHTGWLNLPPNISSINNLPSWIPITIALFAVGVISVSVFNTLIETLEKNIHDQVYTTQELDDERKAFENRRKEVERRGTQIQTAAEISRTISSVLDPDQLFSRVVNLVKDRFDLYYVGVFIVDSGTNYAVLRAGTGEAGQAMLDGGHKLVIDGHSMIGWAISRRQARIALDVGLEPVHFDNPFLPDTRSELALPMVTSTQVLGALTVQSNQPEAFDDEDILILQGIADSLSIAWQNAILFQQAEDRLKEIQSLHQQYMGDAWFEVARQAKHHYRYNNPHYTQSDIGESSTHKKPISIRNSVIGNLILESDKATWDPEEDAFIEAVISQAAIALENVRLMEITQRSAQNDRLISDISSKAWASTDIETILQTTLRELVQGLHATNGVIVLDTPKLHHDTQ